MKRLVGPIEICTLEETEYLSMGKYLFFVSVQDACRAKRTLKKILLVVFGSVSTRGPIKSFFKRKHALFERTHAGFSHHTEGLAPTRSQILSMRR
jgi:hypothetical protein